ncbi:hypothetical protein WJU16_09115 [Chitinophaga pollutisoli]|uniref:Uncharacterized protein n=1 Tax=Chitinophaga pollutisoli TaxID=3133966 RepID=A0ABZ2YTX2_9BACT
MNIGNYAVGYHGCDARVAARLLNEREGIFASNREFEWLGHGMYFWENNLKRGLDWARQKCEKKQINQPAVVGALLDLRNCCDFSDQRYLDLIRAYHLDMKQVRSFQGQDMPVNFAPTGTLPKDIVSRNLDCGVIEHMHTVMGWLHNSGVQEHFAHKTLPFDSVRGLFIEGQPVFNGSGIYDKSHIQICIRNSACIKGFFLPREREEDMRDWEVREDPAEYLQN